MAEDCLNILLIKDTKTDAEIAEWALEKAMTFAFDIQWAKNMAEAEAILRTAPDIHLILLDLGLPDTNGRIDTFQKLKNANEDDIPTLVLTSVNDRNLAINIVGDGAGDYIKKSRLSREPEALHEAIGFALCRHKKIACMKQKQQKAMAAKDQFINYMAGGFLI